MGRTASLRDVKRSNICARSFTVDVVALGKQWSRFLRKRANHNLQGRVACCITCKLIHEALTAPERHKYINDTQPRNYHPGYSMGLTWSIRDVCKSANLPMATTASISTPIGNGAQLLAFASIYSRTVKLLQKLETLKDQLLLE